MKCDVCDGSGQVVRINKRGQIIQARPCPSCLERVVLCDDAEEIEHRLARHLKRFDGGQLEQLERTLASATSAVRGEMLRRSDPEAWEDA